MKLIFTQIFRMRKTACYCTEKDCLILEGFSLTSMWVGLMKLMIISVINRIVLNDIFHF